jgi:hypothetical protein
LGGVFIDLFRTNLLDALDNALAGAAGKALREFPGLGATASSLSNSFNFADDIARSICGYADASIQLAQARAYLLASGLVLAPAGAEGASGLVVLIDNAIPRGWTLVPALSGAAAAVDSPAVAGLATAAARLAILPVGNRKNQWT